MKDFEEFRSICKQELELELSDEQVDMFHVYYDLLIEWNQKMNLTAITELADVLLKHFYDSVSVFHYTKASIKMDLVKNGGSLKLIDVGTGAGFPGIPLKIAYPELKITLLDSLQKRVGFLNTVIDTLHLLDVEAVHGRAEDFGRDPVYRDQYDICVSRAVANYSSLSEFCLPFVKKGGYFISYKSEKAKEEVEAGKHALFLLKAGLISIDEFFLPGTDMQRCFVVTEKLDATPKPYPRKAGTPIKKPL